MVQYGQRKQAYHGVDGGGCSVGWREEKPHCASDDRRVPSHYMSQYGVLVNARAIHPNEEGRRLILLLSGDVQIVAVAPHGAYSKSGQSRIRRLPTSSAACTTGTHSQYYVCTYKKVKPLTLILSLHQCCLSSSHNLAATARRPSSAIRHPSTLHAFPGSRDWGWPD